LAGHLARTEEKRNAYKTLVGEPEGKRPLERPRCKWVNNVKMGLKKKEWTGVICLRIGTSGGSCEDGNEPSGSIKCWEILEYLLNLRLLTKASAL
jgi:hypothetical protein